MRTTITRSAVALAAASVIGLAGCAGADEGSENTEDTMTVTETSETTDISEETVTGGAPSEEQEAPAPINNPEQPEQPAEPPAEPPAEEELPMEPVGSEVTIAGQPATVCIYGDGWGTNIWAGNANTSCEFVIATHEAVVEGLNATTQNVREFLPPQVQVTSPVTGETYDMDCAPRGERLVSCTGGDGAEVFFY